MKVCKSEEYDSPGLIGLIFIWTLKKALGFLKNEGLCEKSPFLKIFLWHFLLSPL